MKNRIFYCPLEYRYSQADAHTLVIGLVSYEQQYGKIAFEFDKTKAQENIYNYYPKVQFGIIETYLELIRKKITKNPVEKDWNEAKLKQYLANYVLTPDDSALQFGKITANMEKKAKIYYFSLTDEQTKVEKLEWFAKTKMQDIDFQLIKPDKNGNWINLADEDNGFDELIPVCSKDVKTGKGGNAIFELFANSIKTNRDEWVYDFSKENLTNKIHFFIEKYNKQVDSNNYENDDLDYSIKWSRDLKNKLFVRKKLNFNNDLILENLWRPFTKKYFYGEKILNDVLTENHYLIFGKNLDKENLVINTSGGSSMKPFQTFVTKIISDYEFVEKNQCLPLYRYENGERVENITDWALDLFRGHYSEPEFAELKNLQNNSPIQNNNEIQNNSQTTKKAVFSENLAVNSENSGSDIQKIDIFHYVYAVLHQPEYRTKYEQNLKREFPRIPLYADFWKYAEAGRKLMDLHLNYENLNPYPTPALPLGRAGVGLLERKDLDLEVLKARKQGKKKKTEEIEIPSFSKDVISDAPFTVYPILRIKDGNIEIDELTTLCGVPAEALAYKLGNRSAIEWVLDQYKPYKSDDKTIQEQFNNYNFADYKEQVIDLLQKVCFVSVETMRIVGEL